MSAFWGSPRLAERPPSPDERAGMDWWNSLAESERGKWLTCSGGQSAADAWAFFKKRLHDRCSPGENCGRADCPGLMAGAARDLKRGDEWSALELVGELGGLRHYLDRQPIHCGEILQLQHVSEEYDNYGSFMTRIDRGTLVRYEANLRGAEPVVTLYAGVGGHEFVARLEPWMRFRWPGGGS